MGVRLTIRAIHPDGTTAASQLELDQARIAFGRATASDVVLPHPSVSPLHATLRVSGTGYGLVDEVSTNGTFVAGNRLVSERPRTVRSGEIVQIGPFRIEIVVGIAVAQATTNVDPSAAGRRLLPESSRSFTFENGSAAGMSVELPKRGESLVLGRAEDAFLRTDDAECSRRHALVDVDDDAVIVRDAESKNGIVVNGKSASKRVLRDGDELMLGATRVRFHDPRDKSVREIARAAIDEPFEAPLEALADGTSEVPPLEVSGSASGAATGIEIVETETPVETQAPPRAVRRERLSSDALTDRFAFGLAILVLILSIAGFVLLFGDAQ